MPAKKLSVRNLTKGLLRLQEAGDPTTLLCIGPMSSNLLRASFELARDHGFPLMFIASRNQVDLDELGGGYANGWNQRRFSRDIKKVARETGFDGPYYLCRDHGGPWQRDSERNAHLPEQQAMELAKKSYLADLEAGFDLLMIDPTKDPYQIGKTIPLDVVMRRTVELIDWCEKERMERGLPEIAYEVGTEETNGGLTSTEKYREFVEGIRVELEARNLPMPSFIVGQTGTLTRMTSQVGHFDYKAASALAEMAGGWGVGLKEHNGDYLDDVSLLEHLPAHVMATNVAPQFGTEETRAYVDLCKLEQRLADEGLVPARKQSSLLECMLTRAVATERWRKWMVGDDVRLSVGDIMSDKELAMQVLDISGHYVFSEDEVREETDRLYDNLSLAGVDGRRYVVNRIKRPISRYVEAYNLQGSTERIMAAVES